MNHFRCAIDNNPDFSDITGSAKRNSFVILADDRLNEMRQFKAGGCKVLAYKNLTLMTPWTNAGVPMTGLLLPDSFYLHNKAGQRFTSQNFPQAFLANPQDPAYQARWGNNVIPQLLDEGWDGVFMDDTNPSPSYHHDPNDIKELQGNTAYSAAVGSMLSAVTPRIHAAGKLAVANIGAINDYPVTRTWIANYLDGAMWEWWSGTQSDRDTAAYAQSKGKFLLARQSGGNALYGFSSMLLCAEDSCFAYQSDYTHEPTWLPEFDIPLGKALGAAKEVTGT